LAEWRRVYIVGICGTAMATLAALLRQRGVEVWGSDQAVYPPMSDFLAAEGVRVHNGYDAAHVPDDADVIVVGNTISRGNPELEAVLERRLRYTSLPEAVRDQFLWGARVHVVAGTHGKTTTTSLLGWLLTHGALDPTVFVGGIARNFGDGGASYRLGSGGVAVIEGDEYDSAFFDKSPKFLKYVPHVAIIGNVEFDHADIYADLDAIRVQFRRLCRLVPRSGLLVLGGDDPEAAALAAHAQSPVETVGFGAGCTWQARGLRHADGIATFDVFRDGAPVGEFRSPLAGAHNVRNALAAIAAGTHAGLDAKTLAAGLAAFKGVRRRLERVGEARGVIVLDDFAHHPTAVRETLAALRVGYPGRRLWAVFEPRSNSSCRRVFQDDFADAFTGADEVVIAAVFRATLPEAERLSPELLVRALETRGTHARHVAEVDDIVATVAAEARAGDVVAVMSNGGFGGIHGKLVRALGSA
jgi:UDP-N-acetylmuramate: L-alanyl-gamma-D-glutamyl-meso-diaminopimelate ligase